mgnify:CR=1 FL=1
MNKNNTICHVYGDIISQKIIQWLQTKTDQDLSILEKYFMTNVFHIPSNFAQEIVDNKVEAPIISLRDSYKRELEKNIKLRQRIADYTRASSEIEPLVEYCQSMDVDKLEQNTNDLKTAIKTLIEQLKVVRPDYECLNK